MIRNDEQWLAISDLFLSASAGAGDWAVALNALADVCGAMSGELIGVGADAAVPFNWMPRVDPAATAELIHMGGGHPQVNPRVRIGVRAPVLQAWHEVRCATDDELRRNFPYADMCRRYEIPYGSQATLIRDGQMLIGLATLRTERQGVPQADDRRAFEALAAQVRAAVKIQLTLEGRGAELMAGALSGVGLAVFICDGLGLVRAMTPQAEEALSRGVLRLNGGRLAAARTNDARALDAALERARSGLRTPGDGPLTTIVARDPERPDVLEIVDIIALPREPYAFGFEPRALVVARRPRALSEDTEALLRTAFGLTPAEAQVAVLLGAGEATEAIAETRAISPATVRSHIKAIFQKVQVSRRSELAARLRQFL